MAVDSVTSDTMAHLLQEHPDLREEVAFNLEQARETPNCAGINFLHLQCNATVSSLVPLIIGNASRGIGANDYGFRGADWKHLLETPGVLEQHLSNLQDRASGR